jgi:hypothetical protein
MMDSKLLFTHLSWPFVALVVAVAACSTLRTDPTAFNTDDTRQYQVLAHRPLDPGGLEIRVRVQNLNAAEGLAKNVVHQKANPSPSAVRLLVVGPPEAPDATPGQIIHWPEEPDDRTP